MGLLACLRERQSDSGVAFATLFVLLAGHAAAALAAADATWMDTSSLLQVGIDQPRIHGPAGVRGREPSAASARASSGRGKRAKRAGAWRSMFRKTEGLVSRQDYEAKSAAMEAAVMQGTPSNTSISMDPSPQGEASSQPLGGQIEMTEQDVEPYVAQELAMQDAYYARVQEAFNKTEWDLNQPRQGVRIEVPNHPKVRDHNLCIRGHIAPELILIGAIKGASTSFANDCRKSPDIYFANRCRFERDGFCEGGTMKEGHFFDSKVSLHFMLESFPKCDETGTKRMVASDQSPRYFGDRLVVKKMKYFYQEHSPRLKFVAILREPIRRFHSDYHQARALEWCSYYRGKTFADILQGIVYSPAVWRMLTGGAIGCGDRLQASLYKENLQMWLATFEPKQFLIVPFKSYTDPGNMGRTSNSVIAKVFQLLHVSFTDVSKGVSHLHESQHPALEDNCPKDLYLKFKEKLYRVTGPDVLAQLFVEFPGAQLFDYHGRPDDLNALEAWLGMNW